MSTAQYPTPPAVSTIHGEADDSSRERDSVVTRLRLRTQFAFALLTGLGGTLLGTGADTGSLAVIVLTLTLIGFICVDWLELFSLPALVAYGAMALTAVVCIVDFAQDSYVLAPKMVAVAQLLAVAQAILMLQQKSHRLFEQLLTFALLNCIVAAVFNDAFSYAVWFFPLAIVAGFALALLAADETLSRAGEVGRDGAGMPVSGFIRYDNQAARGSLARVSLTLSWTTMLLIVPAVIAVATVIFFALPRRVDAQRGVATAAMVGYDSTVQLGQIGQMQTSQDRALRVKLTDPSNGNKPYPVTDGLYLRGLVLERYLAGPPAAQGGGSWQNRTFDLAHPLSSLPVRFVPSRTSDRYFYDRVHVDVRCEAMRSAALFSIAPYHRIIGSEKIVQDALQWTFQRNSNTPQRVRVRYENIEYHFGTQGFQNGIQTPWIHDLSLAPDPGSAAIPDSDPVPGSAADVHHSDEAESVDVRKETPRSSFETQGLSSEQHRYLNELLAYPASEIPSARSLGDGIVNALPPQKRNPVEIAKRLEQYLSQDDDFAYTLNLDEKVVDGMDPLEQFLSIDRRGHCQYFASALAMMLRSQGIPARLVVGYHCDEFNDLGQYFVVRQSHAHAWVEALIERRDIPLSQTVYGQPKSERYWLRLDPTPGGGGVPDTGPLDGSRRIAEMARDFWRNYIIEMDPDRQDSTFQTAPILAPMSNSYRTWIERARMLALRINSDDLEWPGKRRTIYTFAALAGIILCGAAAFFLRRHFPVLSRRRLGPQAQSVARPSIAFYSETLEILERVGFPRAAGQTSAELTTNLPDERIRNPATVLTQLFYRLRYGIEDAEADKSNVDTIEQSLASLRAGVEKSAERPPTKSADK